MTMLDDVVALDADDLDLAADDELIVPVEAAPGRRRLPRPMLAALLLALSCVLVVVGVAQVYVPAAWIVGGVLLAGLTVLVLGDWS
jgi:hypothetical protein